MAVQGGGHTVLIILFLLNFYNFHEADSAVQGEVKTR